VSGVKAGHISNRQLAIYDKRREVLDTGKKGWLAIWNARREAEGKSPLDLADKHASQVWRFEMRLGSRRRRRGGVRREGPDCLPSRDSNRSRWPLHPAWRIVQAEAARHFEGRRSYADPVEVREANRAAHIEMLDAQLLGLMVSRAAAGGVGADDAEGFFKRHAGEPAAEAAEQKDHQNDDQNCAETHWRYPLADGPKGDWDFPIKTTNAAIDRAWNERRSSRKVQGYFDSMLTPPLPMLISTPFGCCCS
jgi:hypothetical protein